MEHRHVAMLDRCLVRVISTTVRIQEHNIYLPQKVRHDDVEPLTSKYVAAL
jgi:hypothetical protein